MTRPLLSIFHAHARTQWGSWDPVLFYLYVMLEASMNMGERERGLHACPGPAGGLQSTPAVHTRQGALRGCDAHGVAMDNGPAFVATEPPRASA